MILFKALLIDQFDFSSKCTRSYVVTDTRSGVRRFAIDADAFKSIMLPLNTEIDGKLTLFSTTSFPTFSSR
jgi:hypothetical protein